MTAESEDFSQDPRLTAYALGELEGAERAAMEAIVRRDPAAAALVEDIRRAAGLLAAALADEAVDPPAEIVPFEAPARPWLLRLHPFYYIASGLAAAWAVALIVLRPGAVRNPEPSIAVVTKQAMAPAPAETTEENQLRQAEMASRPLAGQAASEAMQAENRLRLKAVDRFRAEGRITSIGKEDSAAPPAGQPILDAARIAGGAPEAKRRIAAAQSPPALAERPAPPPAAPAPTGATSNAYYAANTLSGTRINSTLSDLGGSIQVTAKDALAGGTHPPLLRTRAELRTLAGIDVSPEDGGGHPPGRFRLLYADCLDFGDRPAYRQMLEDPNPVVSAMGGLCLMQRFPDERAAVLAKMRSDRRSITVQRPGSAPQAMTLAELFASLASDPNFLFPMKGAW